MIVPSKRKSSMLPYNFLPTLYESVSSNKLKFLDYFINRIGFSYTNVSDLLKKLRVH